MKFGELLEYEKKEMFFFKNQTENEAVRLVPDLVFLKKHYIRLKKVLCTLILIYFCGP